MIIYDVALWRFWPSSEFPIVDEIEASSPLLAALNLMHRCRLKHASYVAVAAPGGGITRWVNGLSLVLDEETEEQGVSQ
ncbi:hypothetical protein [Dictyobacter aurantiacus]|uniref:Uncharacterized protein n=1 Tax=Dictyobacter aurantiacus TaxID=1936993 RepID=A0A401ZAI6_9CHLR|nr:hypothetical protein [Dictyobacter aurantiacus]GCE03842.1 hypothetical protein KDAU_11710 [Dictyobacter aurantiacus]